MAKGQCGVCYAIVDDRQNPMQSLNIEEDIEYLQLNGIKIISVTEHSDPINLYTKELIKNNYVYINANSMIHGCEQKILDNPRFPFQIKLDYGNQPTIGYSKQIDSGKYIIIYIFDYIIKVLDEILNISDVVTTSAQDIADSEIMGFFAKRRKINYHFLEPYKITGFRYTKNGWPELEEDDPRLLTIKGLKSRHIPPEIIYKFYEEATEQHKYSKRPIKITAFDNIIKNEFNLNSRRVIGVVYPLEVEITNIQDRYTEYALKPMHAFGAGGFNIVPLCNRIYIDRNDFSLVECGGKLSKHQEIGLKYAGSIYCTDVEMDNKGRPTKLIAEYHQKYSKNQILWISSNNKTIDLKPVNFVLFEWFYTGENVLKDPVSIKTGYIDECVFDDLNQIYHIEKVGYFIYDRYYSERHQMPCFIKISSSKHYYGKK